MIETFAVIFSLLSIWLTLKKSIFCWPIGGLGIILYSILFFQNHDYCNMILQSVFLIQSVIGWVNWNKPNSSKVSLYNKTLSANRYGKLILYISFYSFLNYKCSMMIGGSDLVLDSITSVISIVAMNFLIHKKIEAWILWIIADILYIPLFISNGHYLSAILYFTFLLMSIRGFIEWKNEKDLLKNIEKEEDEISHEVFLEKI